MTEGGHGEGREGGGQCGYQGGGMGRGMRRETYDESGLVAVGAVETNSGRQLRHELDIGDDVL